MVLPAEFLIIGHGISGCSGRAFPGLLSFRQIFAGTVSAVLPGTRSGGPASGGASPASRRAAVPRPAGGGLPIPAPDVGCARSRRERRRPRRAPRPADRRQRGLRLVDPDEHRAVRLGPLSEIDSGRAGVPPSTEDLSAGDRDRAGRVGEQPVPRRTEQTACQWAARSGSGDDQLCPGGNPGQRPRR